MMKKFLIIISIILNGAVFAQSGFTEISGMPGAFSRMGFGARGMGMGNAVSAVTTGNLVSYYNPALAVFQKGNSFSASYSVMSLDRSLNFLNFTKRFDFGKKENGEPKSSAGLSLGIINQGVSNIDGRDKHGLATGDLTTSENQFFLGFANKFSKKLSIGIALKLYYNKLYEEVTATTVGIDVGVLYQASDALTFSGVVQDINSKYKWDTGKIYGDQGSIIDEKFPLLMKLGSAYNFSSLNLIASVEYEHSNAGTDFIRFGGEYEIYKNLFLRTGVDRFNINDSEYPARPSAGFSYFYNLDNWIVGIDYAFVAEPYSASSNHIVGLNIKF